MLFIYNSIIFKFDSFDLIKIFCIFPQVNKLQRAHLKDPVRVAVSSKYQPVSTVKEYMLFIPCKHKVSFNIYILLIDFIHQKS